MRVKAPLITRISRLKISKNTNLIRFPPKGMAFWRFFEQNSIRREQDVSCMIRITHDTLKENGGVFMRYKREFTKSDFEELEAMP